MGFVRRGRVPVRALILGFFLILPAVTQAAEPAVEVEVGAEKRSFTREELLARPDAITIEVPKEVTSGAPMTYRAVPAAALLSGLDLPAGKRDRGGRHRRLRRADPARPDAQHGPEQIDGLGGDRARGSPLAQGARKDYTAGPFYVVWTKPEASGIRSEYWAYQLGKLRSQLSPTARWPALAVDAGLPADDPARAGEALYVAQCLPCHKLNGGGASDVGGDLNLPMNATEYMTAAGLHALIRDPKSVRFWPGMKMQGWSEDLLSDREIDHIIAYLKHMAGEAAP